LVVIEHKDNKIASASLNAITAATKIGGPVAALVAGSAPETVASAVASVPGIEKVIVAKGDAYDHGLPETHAPLIAAAATAGSFTHIVSPHSAFGKNVVPRAAALLDVSQVSDVIGIESEDTFVRPIYAGVYLSYSEAWLLFIGLFILVYQLTYC
jgi:electron transfer flavoprotein alpha subunit